MGDLQLVGDPSRNSVDRELESKNGTWVDGKRVTSSPLRDGDELILGRTRAVIRVVRNDATMTVPPLSGNRG